MYGIKVTYKTGDSFTTQTTNEVVDYGWKDLDVVKENVKAILEHNKYYHYIERWYHKDYDEIDKFKNSFWFLGSDDEYKNTHGLLLKLDNGELVRYTAPWCGCFESLEYIEVVMPILDEKFYPEL